VHAYSRQLLGENAELRRRLAQWEHVNEVGLRPYLERTGNLDITALHNALARVAGLALAYGVPHQQLLNAARPDPRGAAGSPTATVKPS